MKTKIWIIAGVLIIALATMAMPVMADDVGVQGDNPSSTAFSVPNTTLKFASFGVGTNYISPDHLDSTGSLLASIHMTTVNDPVWHIRVSGTHTGHMEISGNQLAAQMKIKNATVNDAVGGILNAQAITGSAANLFTGGNIGSADIPLELSQVVASTDPAANGYAITVTLTYVPS